MSALYIIMVGLPARGKSILTLRISEVLEAEGVRVRVFNNGHLRRARLGPASSLPDFYHPENEDGRVQRERLALINAREARAWLGAGGQVAILDATNGSASRRALLASLLTDAPILYVECVNDDPDLIAAGVQRKALLPEFSHLSREEAVAGFMERIGYYERIYSSPRGEGCYVRVDTLHNTVLEEKMPCRIPYYLRLRDILTSGWVRELFLVRHGQSVFNVQGRIGGDSPLTALGRAQARALAREFGGRDIPYVFTSRRLRSQQTAAPLLAENPGAVLVRLDELDEIDAGSCDSMAYEEIRRDLPREYNARARDKYHYRYPRGEGYSSMRERVERGFLKALFLSGGQPGIVLIGHQAVNRMILSLFLYRRTEDVPYIYIPQDQYFRIVATCRQKSMELIPFRHIPDEGEAAAFEAAPVPDDPGRGILRNRTEP
ncbi:MAG: 6-phosphofructo-2-kinase/fructose-2,6-bisphosphatase [Desulfovibrio sp.]|jgi:broad specificity phosphatase PhoE/predicted kinase|nr:6-phosphofructo-2-kinase/fructose-2,6-bisphosphatase [Desulfovibrio sp.]